MRGAESGPSTLVRHFRQILVWPLQLMPAREGAQIQRHWELLESAGDACSWHELADEFTGDASQFQERHYAEFVTFLPHVQRFLYGEGRPGPGGSGRVDSPIKVFRRGDVAEVRVTYTDGEPPVSFAIAHADLYFFYDLDVVILALEIHGRDLSLQRAQDMLHKFGRAYPAYWGDEPAGHNCLARVEWLSASGDVLAASDYQRREDYLAFVCRNRSPRVAAHWEFLLRPLAPHDADPERLLRYRQLEFHRMPVLGFLTFDDPLQLSREDFVRLGLVLAPGQTLAPRDRNVREFESRCCLDRHWSEQAAGLRTRITCSGEALMVIGSAGDRRTLDGETGVLAAFRHQYFLLFLIAHLHRAALLMLSDRLVTALNRLDINSTDSIRGFKRAIRQLFEIFLRFTHRYWFHEVSGQVQSKQLFDMCRKHLDTERLFIEVQQEIQAMSSYLDSDSLRRQANTIVNLTVVTIAGLVGTLTTGFIGMNVIDAADQPLLTKIGLFVMVLVPIVLLTAYTIAKARRFSDFLEALSNDRMPGRAKWRAFAGVWRAQGRIGKPAKNRRERL